MECRVVGKHYETPYFHSHRRNPPFGMTLPRTVWFRFKAYTQVSVFAAPACRNGGITLSATCECGAEEQAVDHVVITVKSIDLPMDCTT